MRGGGGRGWGVVGGRQRLLSLGSDQTRAPGLPGDVTRPTSPLVPFSPSSPCCQSCVRCFTLLHDAPSVCVCAQAEPVDTSYRDVQKREQRRQRDARGRKRALRGSVEPEKEQMYKLNVARSEASHNELQ